MMENDDRKPPELVEIEHRNQMSARLQSGMLEQLRRTLSAETSTVPEIALVNIPEIRVVDADESLDFELVAIPPEALDIPLEESIRAEHSITDASETPDDARQPSTFQADSESKDPQSGKGPAAKSGKDPKPHSQFGSSHAGGKNKSSAEDARCEIAWFHSLPDLLHDQATTELTRRIVSQFGKRSHAALQFISADEQVSTNRTTARIATTIAEQVEAKVLLVDANWEANLKLTRAAGEPVRGLSEVLRDNIDWESCILPTENEFLKVLPCGVAELPNRRLESAVFMSLISRWQKEFDYVCVNSGYVKQLITRRLAVCCHAAYILVGLNQTTKADARYAAQLLAESHARVMGAIVFDSPNVT